MNQESNFAKNLSKIACQDLQPLGKAQLPSIHAPFHNPNSWHIDLALAKRIP
jgi:hypothetical protein